MYRMTRSKFRQYRCLLNFSLCDDNKIFEGDRQRKFVIEVNYKFFYTSYAKYALWKHLNILLC